MRKMFHSATTTVASSNAMTPGYRAIVVVVLRMTFMTNISVRTVQTVDGGTGVAAATLSGGSMTEMVTKGQVLVVNADESIRLDCEFKADAAFNLFDNPVWWRKAQRHEERQINMMANVLEPFESTRRFRVSFHSRTPNYTLRLFLSDVKLEDSGNYTCEINGPLNSLLGSVTHYLFVRAAVSAVSLLTHNGSEIFSTSRHHHFSHHHLLQQPHHYNPVTSSRPTATSSTTPHQRHVDALCTGGETSLVFVETVPGVLRCVAVGGYPPPEVQLFVGRRDVTAEFGLTHVARLEGKQGLRVMYHVTERWSHRFTVGAADDGSRVTCVVSVSGLAWTSCSARLNVYYAPVVTCESSLAQVGDRSVRLACKVKARPKVTAVFWIIDANTTVSGGQVVDEHWTIVEEGVGGDGEVETHYLYMRQVKQEHFRRRYTLVAENSVSARSQDATLRPKYRTFTRDTVVSKQLNDSVKASSTSSHSAEYLHNGEPADRRLNRKYFVIGWCVALFSTSTLTT